VSLAKKEIDLDTLSLEGLEDLLDQIFGPVADQTDYPVEAPAQTGGHLCLSAEQNSANLCATLPDTKVARHKIVRDIRHPKQEQVLLNQVKILRARLHFALEQLEHARMTEASLRLSLAYAKDKLKQHEKEPANTSDDLCEITSQ